MSSRDSLAKRPSKKGTKQDSSNACTSSGAMAMSLLPNPNATSVFASSLIDGLTEVEVSIDNETVLPADDALLDAPAGALRTGGLRRYNAATPGIFTTSNGSASPSISFEASVSVLVGLALNLPSGREES